MYNREPGLNFEEYVSQLCTINLLLLVLSTCKAIAPIIPYKIHSKEAAFKSLTDPSRESQFLELEIQSEHSLHIPRNNCLQSA